MVYPVIESGTAWTVLALGDTVVGDDVCGYMA